MWDRGLRVWVIIENGVVIKSWEGVWIKLIGVYELE